VCAEAHFFADGYIYWNITGGQSPVEVTDQVDELLDQRVGFLATAGGKASPVSPAELEKTDNRSPGSLPALHRVVGAQLLNGRLLAVGCRPGDRVVRSEHFQLGAATGQSVFVVAARNLSAAARAIQCCGFARTISLTLIVRRS
jgi:hypothetical protein